MKNPKAYRVHIRGEGHYREFDACVRCALDEKHKLEKDETMETLGYGTSMHIEDTPENCDICSQPL